MAGDRRILALAGNLKSTLLAAIPGLLIGLGGTVANTQAGQIAPDLRWLIGGAILGAIVSAVLLTVVRSRRTRTVLTLAILVVSALIAWFAQNPDGDEWSEGQSTSSAISVGDVAIGDGGGSARPAPTTCAQMQLAGWPEIDAVPVPGAIGSVERPLRIEVKEAMALAVQIETQAPDPYKWAELRGRITSPLDSKEIAFDNALTFRDKLLFEDLQVSEDSLFWGLRLDIDGDQFLIPYGIVELSGGFSDARTGLAACQVFVHLQLVSKASSTLVGKLSLLALAAGVLSLIAALSRVILKEKKAEQQAKRQAEQPDQSPELSDIEVDLDESSPTSVEAVESAGAEVDDRRLGVDAYLEGRRLPMALVADRDTQIEVSIGHDATAELAVPAAVDFGDVDRVSLPVTFLDTSPGIDPSERVEQNETMTLRRDASKAGDVEFVVTPTGDRFTALITVYTPDKTRVIQAATMSADVEPSEDQANALTRSTMRLALAEVTSASMATHPDSSTASLVHDESTAIGSGDFALTASVGNAIGIANAVTAGIKQAASNRLGVEGDDPSGLSSMVTPTLAGAAAQGFQMYTALGLDRFDDVERVQVVSLSAQSVLPLELVYQAKAPPVTDTVCEIWAEFGACDRCSKLPVREQQNLVCPSLFWAVAKIVEHHIAGPERESQYSLKVLREEDSSRVRVPGLAMVGVSQRVVDALNPAGDAEPSAVRQEILRDIRGTTSMPVAMVQNWLDWTDKIHQVNYDLLIAMPHNGIKMIGHIENPALEIGDMLEPFIGEHHVVGPDAVLRPIVLLIGCHTGVQDVFLASFASMFRNQSPLVVATIGEILAKEAPKIVGALVHALRTQADVGGTAGAAVRDARSALLQQGYLAGLQLVAHGDGYWPLEK